MKHTKRMILAIAGMLIFAIIASAESADKYATLKDAIKMLKEECLKLGEPKADGTLLYFGSTKMNGNYTIVDEVKKKYNVTATLFVKKGDSYIRICTNVIKDDGNRAVGTILDPKGKAIQAINKGEKFEGEVDILGKPYDTIYEPIVNSKNETVGVYYVGIPK